MSPAADTTNDADVGSWISGLSDGEGSVRRLRKRIGSVGTGECQACEQAATGELHHEGQERTESAGPAAAVAIQEPPDPP